MSLVVKPPFPRLRRGHPLTNGLVGAWPFYEYSGNKTHDISGRDNHGEINGATWVGSERGAALNFDGVDDIVLNYNEITFSNEFTLVSLANLTILGGINMLCGSGDNSKSNKFGVAFGNMFVRAVPGGALDNTVSDSLGWIQYVLRRDSSNKIDLFLDNSKFRLFSDTAQSGNSTWKALGSTDSVTLQTWEGDIGSVWFYNRAISASEISQLYRDPSVIYEPPKRYWLGATVGGTQELTPDAAVVTATVPDATLSATTTLSTDPATVAVTVPDATLSATISLTPDPAVVTVAAQDPTLSATVELTPAAAVINVTVPDASISVALQELTPEPAVVGVVVPYATITNLLTILEPDSVVISVMALKMAVTRGAVCYRKVCCPDDPSYSVSSGTSPNLNTGSRLTCCPTDPEYSIE